MVCCVTVGTGIGGGLVVSGVLYRGASGVACEWGHMEEGRRVVARNAEGRLGEIVGAEREELGALRDRVGAQRGAKWQDRCSAISTGGWPSIVRSRRARVPTTLGIVPSSARV